MAEQVLGKLPQLVLASAVLGNRHQRGQNLLVAGDCQAAGPEQIEIRVPQRRFGKTTSQAAAFCVGQ
jgi:hypothetical protein